MPHQLHVESLVTPKRHKSDKSWYMTHTSINTNKSDVLDTLKRHRPTVNLLFPGSLKMAYIETTDRCHYDRQESHEIIFIHLSKPRTDIGIALSRNLSFPQKTSSELRCSSLITTDSSSSTIKQTLELGACNSTLHCCIYGNL